MQSVCERVIIINRGKIIADERTENISRTIESGYQTELRIVGPRKEVASALEEVSGVRKVQDTGERDADAFVYRVESKAGVDVRKSVFYLCSKKGWPIVGMNAVGTDLESVFIRLVDTSDAEAAAPMTSRRKLQ